MLRRFAAVVAVLGIAVPVAAQQSQGDFLRPSADEPATRVANRGANFLEIGVGARAQGMAGAVTGLISGVTAMYWNPAGIAATEGLELAFSRGELYEDLDITHNFAGLVMPFASGGLGISYTALSSGDIPRTTETNPGGDDIEFGTTYEFRASAVGLHYGRRLTDRLQVGIAGKIISEGVDNASAQWWGADVGTQFNTGLYGITIGASLTNIGPAAAYEGPLVTHRIESPEELGQIDLPVQFNTTEYQLPTAFRFSIVENLAGGADALLVPGGDHDLRVAVDLLDGVDTDLQLAVGFEYNWREIAYFRGGKRFVNEGEVIRNARGIGHAMSVGGGLRVPFLGRRLGLDYAFTEMNELRNVQIFSLEFGF